MNYDEFKEVILQTKFQDGWNSNLYVYLLSDNHFNQAIQRLSIHLSDLDYSTKSDSLDLRSIFRIFINLDIYFE